MLTTVLLIIEGILRFPRELTAFIRLFKDTPEEQREKIMAKLALEIRSFQDTGRPSWGE